LLRYFSLASLLAFVAVTLLLALFYRNTAIQAMIEQEESKNVAVTQTFANSVRRELAAHLTRSAGLPVDELRSLPSLAGLRHTIAAERAGLPVAKIKIYNAAGIAVFSTEADQIGKNDSANAGFLTARAGGVVSELTHRDAFSTFDGVLEDQDVLSTYLPVRLNGPQGEIAGVFELYSTVTPLLQRIDATERTLIFGAAAILLVLYGVLFLIVRHADDVIRRQREEHRQSEATVRRQQLALVAARERERLGRDLHDSVGQVLGYVNIQAQAAAALLAKGQSPGAHQLLQRLVEVVQQAQVDVREQIHVLQGGDTPQQELATALAEYVAQFRQRSGLRVELINVAALQNSALPRTAQAQLLGILQEALTNVQKHAQARRVRVSFALHDAQLLATIADDGAGFALDQLAQQEGRHFGLRIMRDRAAEIGGVLHVQSAPGRGAQVKVKVPLSPRQQPVGQPDRQPIGQPTEEYSL
jgi:signal transduction histidine kinase